MKTVKKTTCTSNYNGAFSGDLYRCSLTEGHTGKHTDITSYSCPVGWSDEAADKPAQHIDWVPFEDNPVPAGSLSVVLTREELGILHTVLAPVNRFFPDLIEKLTDTRISL
jgi:hypothetical protein